MSKYLTTLLIVITLTASLKGTKTNTKAPQVKPKIQKTQSLNLEERVPAQNFQRLQTFRGDVKPVREENVVPRNGFNLARRDESEIESINLVDVKNTAGLLTDQSPLKKILRI